MTTKLPVTFHRDKTSTFAADLKREVDSFFERTGRSRFGGLSTLSKTAILFTVTFGSYAWILTGTLPGWAMLVLTAVMGVGVAGLGFVVGHESIHGATFKSRRANGLLGMTFDLLGASSYLWSVSHNRIHHTWTNVPGADEDIVVSPLLRLSPHTKLRGIHRIQHLLAWPLYGFITLNWVFWKDFDQLLAKRLGPLENLKHSRGQIAGIFAGKVLYHAWTIVIPLLVLDVAWWQFLIGYLVMHLTAGFILSVVFQLAHVVEPSAYPEPDEHGVLPDGWHAHQLRTTMDFATRNKLLTWYVGGLNHQVEHHLFPRISCRHYANLRPIVKRVAEKHGLPHLEMPGFLSALRSHYRMLKRLGASPAIA
jgi:linoleoyl-CoA desaturase